MTHRPSPEAIADRAKARARLYQERPQCHRCAFVLTPRMRRRRQCEWDHQNTCALEWRERLIREEHCR